MKDHRYEHSKKPVNNPGKQKIHKLDMTGKGLKRNIELR